MQDEYNKAFGKIQMSDERKKEMRDVLAAELRSSGKKAKRTALTGGQKAGIAAAAVAITMAGVLCIPVTRNAIYATIKSIFEVELPENAVDSIDYDESQRDMTREAVSEWPEIKEDLDNYYKEQDEFFESVKTTPENFQNMDLASVAKYYEDQGYNILDLGKADDLGIFTTPMSKDFHDEGFYFTYWVGDNASGYSGQVLVFKASEEQLQNCLDNITSEINKERLDHAQGSLKPDEIWTESTDAEGNTTYVSSWVGPEPEIKLEDSDSARFMNNEVTYNATSGIAVCKIEQGGGVG